VIVGFFTVLLFLLERVIRICRREHATRVPDTETEAETRKDRRSKPA